MAQKKYLQAKLTQFLREDRIQLWKPPYTDENKKVGLALKDLAKKYSDKLECCENEVEKIIEEIRCKAVERGTGNEHYKATGIATIEVFLPPRVKKDRKNLLETRLHVTGRELRSKIAETFGFQENYIKIVINKKQLQLGKTLEEQGVTHNVKAMVLELKQSEEDVRKNSQVEEEEQNEARLKEKRIQRTKRGLEILAERAEMVVDPETTPYLDIANQTGRSIRIPPSERKALMLAMGYHEKGRAFLKRKEYGIALPCLLDADRYFCECCRELLDTVDNYAVLQLDIAWCYFRLGQLECLDDAEKKLNMAQRCFKNCYGENHQRLVHIKGNCGKEKVLFLRLYLLQGIRNYHSGNGEEAYDYLNKACQLFKELYIDPSKVHSLMQLGFSAQEARLGLRACDGNVDHAAAHITNRREKLDQIRKEEKEKKRRRLENINYLKGMGYSARAAKQALHQASGNLEESLQILLSQPQMWWLNDSGPETNSHQESPSRETIDQLVYMGFDAAAAEAALRVFRGNVQLAAQTLAHNGGSLPSDLRLSAEDSSATPPTSPSDSAGTSSASTDEDMETEAVNEILEDIPEHEEDYLDSTLEDEEIIIAEYLSYVESIKTATKRN
ncbi:NEDD8 ultimate buster 1 isoform X2 [Orcinus orca]|uniref:NEDD8 ultimate buster 1 isoform X2 n=2 Tax=Delphinidae TaxID=9726 RepID=UPI0002BD0F53|nr:NEDD8 ultimate buster 1 isoform X2 [Orcinus orca]XP_026957267.1 NEDD8 ultimate buster 1 isoform X2 [Lagenorhynchus obliquidens]XP_030710119.1 NEDD8 ultimate buster 1 isoform X3 [Globicephala melas]XP_060012313.1 NEDD8 ultimate buster 1 isoform X2 [Lagenorhynchus albirostris]